ncbi:hypothetical protein BP5796_05403 [Coleophoma crateriformis]|uniref:Amidoligase enzyme-domain-containing protein n=1 Tax=Coleophoma crateriformis TaxID=565419 RepID=A0A3D8S358_9HELO|nr:hypothetical protein BP5796_05403 [Coleophoma crateriformis]
MAAAERTQFSPTFGVEFEFALATLEPGKEDPHPNDPRQVYGLTPRKRIPTADLDDDDNYDWSSLLTVEQHIVETLTRAGIPVLGESAVSGDTSEVSTSWVVSTDYSVEGPKDPLNYVWYPMEIQSPAFHFTEAAIQNVKFVCSILAETYRINVNESCGLHVHVGNMTNGYSLKQLKCFMATVWTFEPQLDFLHPAHRLNNKYCEGLRKHAAINHFKSPAQVLVEIKNAADANCILAMMRVTPLSKSAYEISNLCQPPIEEIKRTIEFRQHEGCIDPRAVEQWIRTCVGIVEFAAEVDEDAWFEQLLEYIEMDREDFSVVKALMVLGLPLQARYYGLKLFK